MPMVRIKHTQRAFTDLSKYEQAYEQIRSGTSLRIAANNYDLSHVSLMRYKNKIEAAEKRGSPQLKVTMGYKPHNKVFSGDEESQIADYIIKSADIFYGLSPKEIRTLAFDLAFKYNLKRPLNWDTNRQAGNDWYFGFMKRHPHLAERCTRARSFAKANGFSMTDVNAFFDILSEMMDSYKFEAKDIYNMDKTEIKTMVIPERVVARTGLGPVDTIASSDYGIQGTLGLAVNAIGNSIPPMFIFPRKRYHGHFVRNGPIGCIGAGNATGEMRENEFLIFLKHFQKHVYSSPTRKVLLLLDDNSPQLSVKALDFGKNNGIVMLSFPPHCSHKLQPLKLTVFGAFKESMNNTCDAWMRSNPGKSMTIYDLPAIVATALPFAITPMNIQSGFKRSGVYPFNKLIFTELDFSSSDVINSRPSSQIIKLNGQHAPDEKENLDIAPTSKEVSKDNPTTSEDSIIKSNHKPTTTEIETSSFETTKLDAIYAEIPEGKSKDC